MTARPIALDDLRGLSLLPVISQENKGLASRAMSALRRRHARSSPIPTATASPIPTAQLFGRDDGGEGPCRLRRPEFRADRDELVPEAVAVSPGAPCHVLLDDEIAEHIAGCNMAFRRDVLLGSAGSIRSTAPPATMSTSAGVQDAGYAIGYSPAALSGISGVIPCSLYRPAERLRKAEALVYGKHPSASTPSARRNGAAESYGDLSSAMLLWKKAADLFGTFGRGLFQTLYQPPASLFQYLPLTSNGPSVAALALSGSSPAQRVAADCAACC